MKAATLTQEQPFSRGQSRSVSPRAAPVVAATWAKTSVADLAAKWRAAAARTLGKAGWVAVCVALASSSTRWRSEQSPDRSCWTWHLGRPGKRGGDTRLLKWSCLGCGGASDCILVGSSASRRGHKGPDFMRRSLAPPVATDAVFEGHATGWVRLARCLLFLRSIHASVERA